MIRKILCSASIAGLLLTGATLRAQGTQQQQEPQPKQRSNEKEPGLFYLDDERIEPFLNVSEKEQVRKLKEDLKALKAALSPQYPFLHEPEPFRDAPALQVACGTMQEHSIAALMTEGVIGETCRCTCHDPSPLLTGIEPVAQFRFLIQRIQVVLSDDAGESTCAGGPPDS